MDDWNKSDHVRNALKSLILAFASQRGFEHIQCLVHRGLSDRFAAQITEQATLVLGFLALGCDGEVDETNRFFFRSAARSGDAGDGNNERGFGTRHTALGH